MQQNITITAGQPVEINQRGDFFRLLGSINSDIQVDFYRNGKEVAEAKNIGGGYAEEFSEYFDRVVIQSASTQAISFTIRLGNRVFFDAPPTGAVNVQNVRGPATQAAPPVTTASGQLMALNAERRFLLIQNKDPAGNIWVNFTGAAATQANGVRIGPGDSLSLESWVPTGAITAIGDLANNPNVVTVEG
jgi:hypothetical protein